MNLYATSLTSDYTLPLAAPLSLQSSQVISPINTCFHSETLLSSAMLPKQLNFITGNKNKLTEVKAILGNTVDLQSQALDLVEIQGTIEEVTVDKCRRAAELVHCHPVSLF
jgi:hypothetical protein